MNDFNSWIIFSLGMLLPLCAARVMADVRRKAWGWCILAILTSVALQYAVWQLLKYEPRFTLQRLLIGILIAAAANMIILKMPYWKGAAIAILELMIAILVLFLLLYFHQISIC